MTTLYKPVRIESAEQAEALPVGTIATFAAPGLITAAVKNAGPLPGWWCGDARVPVGAKPGWTALVPIEAEEIHSEDHGTHHLLEAWTSTHPITAYFPKENP